MQGVSVGAVFAMSWAIAGGLAAVGGTFAGDRRRASSQPLWLIALVALPGDHPRRAGLARRAPSSAACSSAWSQEVVGDLPAASSRRGWAATSRIVTPYVLMLLVLLVRPYGLFGTREVERV